MTDFCDKCPHYQLEEVTNPSDGKRESVRMCIAHPEDPCPATLAMMAEKLRGEVVIPCPSCSADLDGKGGQCDNCG